MKRKRRRGWIAFSRLNLPSSFVSRKDYCERASGHSGTPDLRNPSMKRSVIQA